MKSDQNLKLNRLRWKCRRGMLELDLMLQRGLERYPQFTAAQQIQFETMLELEDPTLHAWLSGTEQPAPEFVEVISLVRR